MDLRRLRHLVVLAEQRNFQRAAEQLKLSQPALTRSVQAAEREAGLRLFDRSNAGVTPTPAGEFLLERARRLVFDSRSLARDMQLLRERKLGNVAFGVGPFPAGSVLPGLLAELRSEYPAICTRVVVGNWDWLTRHLLSEDIEFFIADVRDLPKDPDLECRVLGRMSVSAFVRPGHPLLKRRKLQIANVWEHGVAIGDEHELKRHDIGLVHRLPGVGQNLQDHIDYVQSWKVPSDTASVGISLRGAARLAKGVMDWRRNRQGLMTTTYATTGAFLRSSPDQPAPDLQLIFVIAIVDDHARKAHLGHGISCHVDLLRPRSRGEVTLSSKDPHAAPRIDPRFFRDARDLEQLMIGARRQQAIMESRAFDGVRGKMLYAVNARDDEALHADIRGRADTQYHPVGTCKMGPATDPMAVVDAQLRVHGVQGLRVVDASVMPTLVGGNTNAPTIMIAERAADWIRGKAA
ncbi:MAG: LysR family transcriptional regulator [Paucibacter sp.]|nr:LysR family transcriptional regulator [Roseateles sp.]